MTVAIALASALLVIGMAVSEGLRRAQRREQLLRSDPLDLVDPAPIAPGLSGLGAGLSALVGLLVAYHLAVPTAAEVLRSRVTALALAAASCACAAHLLIQEHRSEERLQKPKALLAFLLLTLGVCVLLTLPAPRDARGIARHVGIACLAGLAMMFGFWRWLAGVWLQQLDQGVAWTTAGRLIPVARAMSVIAAVLALAKALFQVMLSVLRTGA